MERRSIALDSWDAAIKKAKLKIAELKLAIGTFEAKKKAGEPWPGNVTLDGDTPNVEQHK